MKIQLTSCDAARPDRRAITKMLEEVAVGMDSSLARELTDILLDGSPVDIELGSKHTSSGIRSIRKLDINYDIVE